MSEKLNQDLRQLYEATENNMDLEIQKAVKNGTNKTDLTKRLKIISDKSIKMLKELTDDEALLKHFEEDMGKYNRKLIISSVSAYMGALRLVKRLARVKPLADAIYEAVQKGIDAEKTIRVNNRTWSYKAYMEMNARTTVQQSIGDKQLEIGKQTKQVFYLCNVFTDSADDHAKYQGKMYYDDRWKTFIAKKAQERIQGVINQKKMKSVQWVKDEPVYLTTRPNCRHRLTPISLDQATQSSAKVLKDLKLTRKTYKSDNYKALQKQRYNERMIRKYKARAEKNEKLGYSTKKDKALVRQWQSKQRELIKANSTLERDYRRESNFIIVQDMGARYK